MEGPQSQTAMQHISREDGAMIAYHQTLGKSPGVIFLTGFKSDMTGGKALALEALCRARGQAFIRFDYYGHGGSSGAFDDGSIGRWANDAVFVLDRLCEGPQVLVGSSMGGWIMLLAALARPERVAGLVGTASAPDFTADLMMEALTDAQKADLARQGWVEVPNCYEDEEPYRITQALIDEGNTHLVLRDQIHLDCPVRLIHGMMDADVPFETSLRLLAALRSKDVDITLVKDGDHRLSEDHHLDRLCRTVAGLLDRLEA